MAFNWQRQHERALDEARKALELDPNFPLAYDELGVAYVHLGQAATTLSVIQARARCQSKPSVLVSGRLTTPTMPSMSAEM